jgi:hypothetical protein
VLKPAPEALLQQPVERLLAGVPERRVAEVVAEADRLGEILVQPQRTGDRARDPARLERVRQTRAVVVSFRRDEDLRLVLEPPEALGVDDPVAVALERRAQAARRLLDGTLRGIRARRERRQRVVLERPHAGLERGRDVLIGERCIEVGGVGFHQVILPTPAAESPRPRTPLVGFLLAMRGKVRPAQAWGLR